MECDSGKVAAEDRNGKVGCFPQECVADGLVCSKKGGCQRKILGLFGKFGCACDDNSDPAKFCSMCGTGGQLYEIGGEQICGSPACANDEDQLCSGRGECKFAGQLVKRYQCRCQNFFSGALKCASCAPKDPLINGKCIPPECRFCGGEGEPACADVEQETVECGGNGSCIPDLLTILGLSESSAGMCICNVANMDDMCVDCKAGYKRVELEDSFECVSDECSGCDAQFCKYNADRKRYQCVCEGNYDPKHNCAKCYNHFSMESGCTVCEQNYAIESFCSRCIFGYKQAADGQCSECVDGSDPQTQCTTCLGGFEIKKQCKECVHGLALVDGKCVKQRHAVAHGTTIAISCVAALFGAGLIAALVIYLCKKCREAKIEDDAVIVEL